MTIDVARALLTDGFERVRDGIPLAVAGLGPDEILWRPDGEANSIGWLLWHLTRQQDAQLASIAGVEAAWTGDGWAERFGLPYDVAAHGYGQRPDEVAAFDATDPELFTGYAEATHRLTLGLIERLTGELLGRVIDRSWDPPVTVAVRIVSVLDDAAKHLGQAEYLRGLIERRRGTAHR